MIVLNMTINNHKNVVKIKATRIKPTGRTPEIGELCDYAIKVDDEELPYTINCEFGNAAKLGTKMLECIV
jgi:hypothetical protein